MGIFDDIISKYDQSGVPFNYRLMMLGQLMQQAGGGRGGGGVNTSAMMSMMKDARERALYDRTVKNAIEYAKKLDNPELLYQIQNGLISPTELVERVNKTRDLEDQRSYEQQKLDDQRQYDQRLLQEGRQYQESITQDTRAYEREKTEDQRAYDAGKTKEEWARADEVTKRQWEHEAEVLREGRLYTNTKDVIDRQRKADDWTSGMGGPPPNMSYREGVVSPQLQRMRNLTGILDLSDQEAQDILSAGPELGPKAIENLQNARKAKADAEAGAKTDDIKEWEAAGRPGTLQEWIVKTKKAGATNINNNLGDTVEKDGIILGKIPEGYGLMKDPTAPGGYKMIALKGTDDERKIAEDALKAREAAGISATRARTALSTIGNIKRLAEESTLPVIGKYTQMPGYGFVNPSYESVKNELEALGGAIAMENLGDIRATSPTGGALGSITEMENRMMMGYYGNIQQSTDEKTFNENLDRVGDQWRYFVQRNRKAAELYTKDRETGNYDEFNNWVAKEEEALANQLYKEFGEAPVDSLSERDRIKGYIKTAPDDTPPDDTPGGGTTPPPSPSPVVPPSGQSGSLPPPSGAATASIGDAATQLTPPETPPQRVAAQPLDVAEDDVAYYVQKANELPPGYRIEYMNGEENPPVAIDPNDRPVGTIEPDGRIRRMDFKSYTPDELDSMEGITGERKPDQRKRREVIDEQSAMPWPEWLGTTADDIARVGARGITFGGLDWLLGDEAKNKTRESKIRLGIPGEVLEVTGNVTSPLARPISVVAKASPAVRAAYEKAPGILKWLGGGAEGAGVAGASSVFNDGNPQMSAALGGALGLGTGVLGPVLSAIAKGTLGFPSRVGSKAIGEAFKQGATKPSTVAEGLEKQTFTDVMAGRAPDKFQSQYKSDYGQLSKKFIPGNQSIISDATKKKAQADLKARPTTTPKSDTEIKQMMKILSAPKGKGKNTIREWDKTYRDLERFEDSKDAYVAAKARELRGEIRKNLGKVDPNYEKMAANREAGVRGGKSGAKFAGVDPQHIEQLLLASSLLSPVLAATGTLTVPRVAGNIAYRAGQASQRMPSWGGFGGILEKLVEDR